MKRLKNYNLKIFKFIIFAILLISFIIDFLLIHVFNISYPKWKNSQINDWIKNKSKFINYFLSNYKCKDLKDDLKKLKTYLSLKVFLKDDYSPLNFETKKKLRNEFEAKFKKNVSLLKNIFFKRPLNFGNQIAGFNNVIYYCEVLGIKNIYLNSEYNLYKK